MSLIRISVACELFTTEGLQRRGKTVAPACFAEGCMQRFLGLFRRHRVAQEDLDWVNYDPLAGRKLFDPVPSAGKSAGRVSWAPPGETP